MKQILLHVTEEEKVLAVLDEGDGQGLPLHGQLRFAWDGYGSGKP